MDENERTIELQNMAQVFDSLHTAFLAELQDRNKDRARNAIVLEHIKQAKWSKPYKFWAGVARQYTGAHMCDSGGAYGRTHSTPIQEESDPPVTVEFWDGKPDFGSVSTVHFLAHVADPFTPLAQAAQRIFDWYGEVNYHAKWYDMLEDFNHILNMAHGCTERDGRFRKDRFWQALEDAGLVDCEDPDGWRKSMPVKSLKRVMESLYFPLDEHGRGDNTYNHECDLTQVFQWHEVSDGLWAIQTHNGCDVRGGYSNPVFCEVECDYIYDWTVDVYCVACGTPYDHMYRWKEHIERAEPNGLCAAAMLYEEEHAIQMGQMWLACFEHQHPVRYSLKQLAALKAEYERRMAEGDESDGMPWALIVLDDGSFVAPNSQESIKTVDAQRACLLCPECRQYTCHASNSGAYGF